MEQLKFKVKGISPLLMNNPQTVDPFNAYSRAKAVITSKRKKSDEDLLELRRLDIESKLYIDDDIGIYVPGTWVTAAVAGVSFKRLKIAKKDIRGCLFTNDNKIPLDFRGRNKVKTRADISGNPEFFHTMLLKQGQVKIAKSTPIFHEWSFTTSVDFDEDILDRDGLIQLLTYACVYTGWGDFRPTFGRAQFEILD